MACRSQLDGSASLSVLVGLIGHLADKRACEKTWIGLPGRARGFGVERDGDRWVISAVGPEIGSCPGCREPSRRRHIYQQTFIDTYAKVAFAKLYDRKTPITAADLVNDRVVPFYDAHEGKLCRVPTDRGTEYRGNPEHHEYELYLALEDVDHSRTKTKSPQTNGIVERFHKTGLESSTASPFARKSTARSASCRAISMIGSRTTTRKGRTRDDGASAKRRCKRSLTRRRLRRTK